MPLRARRAGWPGWWRERSERPLVSRIHDGNDPPVSRDIGGSFGFGWAWLPLTAGLLGGAAIPLELWSLVFGGALLAWGLAEALARGFFHGQA